MFNLFKKKEKTVHILDEHEIMDRIYEGIAKGHTSAFFYNAELSEKAIKMLEDKDISVKSRTSDGIPVLEIFWK